MVKVFALLSAIFTLFAFGVDPAMAACAPKDTACERQQVAEALPEYTGTKAITTGNVVCLTVWANQPGSLVLAEGRVKPGEAVDGRVITSWRPQASAWSKHPNGGVVREICIPASLLKGTVTLCNEENRSIWNGEDVAYLKRSKRIPSSDPACLLGKDECAKFGL